MVGDGSEDGSTETSLYEAQRLDMFNAPDNLVNFGFLHIYQTLFQ